MLDFVDLITGLGDILTSFTSWRVLLSFAFAVGIIVLICWKVTAPWDIILSGVVGLFAIAVGIIWERRS